MRLKHRISPIVLIALAVALFVGTVLVSGARADALQWDYPADKITDVAEFRLYQRIEGTASYDYDNPILVLPTAEADGNTITQEDGVMTYSRDFVVPLPPNVESTAYFVMRAADDAGNQSGDSNEVSIPFDTLSPEPVLRFMINYKLPNQ